MLDQTLVESVKLSLSQGATSEQLYQNLISQGHTVSEIQEALEIAKSPAEKAETQKKAVSVVVIIGAVLIGAGIFSFIASNWDYLGKASKIAIILISMLLSYGAGWYLREVKNLRKTGAALILLGTIIYGGGIFLVAQMFNIRANWPDGFILWMLGCMVVAYAIELPAFLYFSAVLGVIAIFGHPFLIFDSFSGYNPLLLTSTFLLVLTTVLCFFVARDFRKKIVRKEGDIY